MTECTRARARRWWLRNRPHALIDTIYVAREWGWRFAIELEAHRRRHLRRILRTAPVPVPEKGTQAVHLLVNRSRCVEGIWAAKSFYWEAGPGFALVIHDDGSLTKRDQNLWRSHFPGCRVIARDEAEAITRGRLSEAGHTALLTWRHRFPLALKIVDVKLFSGADKLVFLDTDVLFSGSPSELLAAAKNPDPRVACFNGDFVSVYSLPVSVLRSISGVGVLEKVNTGVMAFSPSIIELDRLERFLVDAGHVLEDTAWFLDPQRGWFLEQTLYAIELSRVGAKRLPDTYMVGQLPEPDGIVCGHYCTRARLDMYRSAYPRLWQRAQHLPSQQ